MRITNEHAHIIQRSVDCYAELCSYLPDEDLEGFNPEHLPYLQTVTRYLRGNNPELVIDAVIKTRETFGFPHRGNLPHSDGVQALTIDDLVNDILEASVALVYTEYEQTENGEWLPVPGKVADLRKQAFDATLIAEGSEELFVELIRDYGDGRYINE